MRKIFDRVVITVLRRDGLWSVEQEGVEFGRSPDKEIARAAAHRRARQVHDEGRACQICVSGENGFYVA